MRDLARLLMCGGRLSAKVCDDLLQTICLALLIVTDALSLKGDGDATITGGGATGADDKVIQHNGAGT